MQANSERRAISQNSVQVVQTLGEICAYAASVGREIKPLTEVSLATFESLPLQNQENILKDISAYGGIVHRFFSAHSPTDMTTEEEREMIDLALDEFGLELADNFPTKLVEKDIVEIYNASGVQIYRNFEFFKKCNYSLLELLVNEWFTLYERASAMTNAILAATASILESGVETEKYSVPVHTLRERFLDRNGIFEIQMKLIAPLLDAKTKKTVAFIHSLEAKEISLGSNASKLHFI